MKNKDLSSGQKLRMHCQQIYATKNVKESFSGKKDYQSRQKLGATQIKNAGNEIYTSKFFSSLIVLKNFGFLEKNSSN